LMKRALLLLALPGVKSFLGLVAKQTRPAIDSRQGPLDTSGEASVQFCAEFHQLYDDGVIRVRMPLAKTGTGKPVPLCVAVSG